MGEASRLLDEYGKEISDTPTEGMPLPSVQASDTPPSELSMVLGTSGQKFQGGHSDEEYHADLTGSRQDVSAKYDQMRTGNALVAGPLGRIEAQLRQADWSFAAAPRETPSPSAARRVEEQGSDVEGLAAEDLEHEMLQFHSSWMFGAPAPEYAMETSWKQQVLHEAATFMAFPSAIFEVIWRKVEGRFGTKIVPQRLAWLHPRSIRAFKINESGRFLGIVQEDTSHGWDDREDESYGGNRQTRHVAYIPAERLLVISRNREGTLPEGTPFTRHMYADAERASHAIKWQLVDAQNRAVGIPFVQIPKGVNGKIIESVKQQARRMTYGNQHLAYVVAPEGIEVGYVDMSANTVDLDGVIKAQERRMRHVTGTEFTALGGDSGSGAMALAKVLREEFNVVVQGAFSALVEDIKRGLTEKAHRWNYGDRLPAPDLVASGLLSVAPEDIAALVESKVIPADLDVTNVARRSIGLGPLAPDTSNEIDLSQINDLTMVKSLIMTGKVLDALHEKVGLPLLSDELREKFDKAPANLIAPVSAEPGAPVASFATAPPSRSAAEDEVLEEIPEGPPATVSDAQLARVMELKEQRKRLTVEAVERLRVLRAEVVADVVSKAQATEGGVKLGGRLAPSKRVKAEFRKGMTEVVSGFFQHGRKTMREEAELAAKAQGKTVNLSSVPIEVATTKGIPARVVEELDLIIDLNVNAILSAIEPTLRDNYRRARIIGLDADEALDDAAKALADSGVRSLEAAGRKAAGAGINAGRSVGLGELREELKGEVKLDYVTRIHLPGPGAHCAPCRKLEGVRVFIDSDDYDRLEPPNFCLGGESCHCAYMLDLSKPKPKN